MTAAGLVSILISEAAGIGAGAGVSMTAAGLVSILISEAAGIGAISVPAVNCFSVAAVVGTVVGSGTPPSALFRYVYIVAGF